jgi:hypothetical protein
MTPNREVATHVIEHFTKHYGTSHDIVVIVLDKDGGAELCATVPVENAIDAISKVISTAILGGGITKARDMFAQFMSRKVRGA